MTNSNLSDEMTPSQPTLGSEAIDMKGIVSDSNSSEENQTLVGDLSLQADLPLAVMHLSEQQKRRKQLDDVVTQVLLADADDDTHKILPFIRWKLTAFGLIHLYDTRDIFLECYDRAVLAVEAGKELTNIPAWFKSTAFFVVREYSRQEKKLDVEPLGDKEFSSELDCNVSDEMSETRLHWLLQAINQISFEDQQLLWLRMQGLSYKQISKQWGETEQVLRQRVSRTLKRLRKMKP